MPPAFRQKLHHRSGGFFDRTACDFNQRPIVPGAKLAREGDLFGHSLAIDILIVVAMRVETEQTILPDLHDPLRARIKPHHQRLGQGFELWRRRFLRSNGV